MSTIVKSCENQAIIDKLEKDGRVEKIDVEFDGIKVPFLACQAGGRIEVHELAQLVDKHRTGPTRRKGSASFTDLASFEAHALRFTSPATTLWADRGNRASPKLVSVLDYHSTGATSPAAFGEHRGVYSFPLSDEWIAWTRASGRTMDQAEFAEFIEQHMIDVVMADRAPSGVLESLRDMETIVATPVNLLKLSRGMKVHVAAEVETAQNLSSGEAELRFSVEHRDSKGGKLRVPGAFVISIPVFHGGKTVSLAAFLRYKVIEKRVEWSFELYRPEAAFDEAFEAGCRSAAEATALPLFFGKPE